MHPTLSTPLPQPLRAGRAGALRRGRHWLALALALALLGAGASPAAADRYDAGEAGHPLRITAYLLHPVGVVLDYLILRPAHWLGSHEPLKTLFGHTEGLGN